MQAVDDPPKNIPKSNNNAITMNCKQPGHTKSSCPKLASKMSKSNALIKKVSDTDCVANPTFARRNKPMDVDAEFAPFISEGFVTDDDTKPPVPVQILRDTGAAPQTLILDGVLPLSSHTSTGSGVLMQGVGGMVPLHRIHIKSGIVSGPVIVGVKSTLPVDGVSLLLGNDLAGDKVTADPIVMEKPLDECDTQEIENEIPGIFSSCAVTRATARALCNSEGNQSGESVDDIPDLEMNENNLGLGRLFKDDIDQGNILVERKVLIKEQNKIENFKELVNRALTEEESVAVPECYYLKIWCINEKMETS